MDYNKKITIYGKEKSITQWFQYLKKLSLVKFDLQEKNIPSDETRFACSEAHVFLNSAVDNPNNDHDNYESHDKTYEYHGHQPEITKADLKRAFEYVAKEVKEATKNDAMKLIADDKTLRIYGTEGDASRQVNYNFTNGKLSSITAGKNVTTKIIDPDGAIINIENGTIRIDAIDGYKGCFSDVDLKKSHPSATVSGAKSKAVVPAPLATEKDGLNL